MKTQTKLAKDVAIGDRIAVHRHYETVVSVSSDISQVTFLVQGSPGETLIKVRKTPNTRMFIDNAPPAPVDPTVWIDDTPADQSIANYSAVCNDSGCVAYFAEPEDAELFARILQGEVVPVATPAS